MIIGLTGYASSGKGEFVKFLEAKGLASFSLSDELRKIALKRGISFDRDSLVNLGNEMREKEGAGYLANIVRKTILTQQLKRVCVDSIRNPGEVEVLRQFNKFYLVGFDVSPEKAWGLMQERNRPGEPQTYEEFLKVYARERGVGENESGQQVAVCMGESGHIIRNDSDLKSLEGKFQKVFKEIEISARPSWDEYFLDIVDSVAGRATCDRGRSGCVITLDNKIVTTGYVGAPKGQPHCDKVGHELKKVTHGDNTISTHCKRTVHAEQNAICQAAELGRSVKGGTLYCKMTPCPDCAGIIINSGINAVIVQNAYQLTNKTEEMFWKAGVRLEYVSREVMRYPEQNVGEKK